MITRVYSPSDLSVYTLSKGETLHQFEEEAADVGLPPGFNGLSMGVDGSPFTMQDKATVDKFMSDRGIPEVGYKVNPTVPCGSAEDCPVGLVCDYSGGRRLRFGATKTGFCVLAE